MLVVAMAWKHWEFWPARLFEAPYYAYLAWRCLVCRLPPRFIAKANYALDHGEFGIGSKFATQMAFAQDRFPATDLLPADLSPIDKRARATAFGEAHGWPLILKPDHGAVGKGLIKVDSPDMLETSLNLLVGDYIVQAYVDLKNEYGVFFVRLRGHGTVTGINQKHFPAVTGDGHQTLDALARAHYRYTPHWHLFLQYLDTTRVLAEGETMRLSFVGSHTMGCKFTNDTALATPALTSAIRKVCDSQPGFNFGRLDVRAASEDAFQAGEFVVIEVNGVASLPTHMFDPAGSLFGAWAIFLRHGHMLVDAAAEHREQPMTLASWREIAARVRAGKRDLEAVHQNVLARQSGRFLESG